MYSKYCGVPTEKIDVCPNVGWIADFGDPQAVLDVPFNGKLIVKNGTNSNWGLVNDPKINAAMEAAPKVVGGKAARRSVGEDRPRTGRRSGRGPVRLGQAGRTSSPRTSQASASSGTSGAWDYAFTSLK